MLRRGSASHISAECGVLREDRLYLVSSALRFSADNELVAGPHRTH